MTCNLFKTVGGVKRIDGCTSGGAPAPAPGPPPTPPPTPFAGFKVELAALGLSVSAGKWVVTELWANKSVPLVDGGAAFVAAPAHHDAQVFAVAPAGP
jgi:hypothetical protein